MWSKVFESVLRAVVQPKINPFTVRYTQKQNKNSVENCTFSTEFLGCNEEIDIKNFEQFVVSFFANWSVPIGLWSVIFCFWSVDLVSWGKMRIWGCII